MKSAGRKVPVGTKVEEIPGQSLPAAVPAEPRGGWAVLSDYVAIARPDHWFKNGFMLIGIVLGWMYQPVPLSAWSIARMGVALVAVCLIASSNYVLNEILDAPSDRHHPTKRRRPLACGRVLIPVACLEWLLLAAVGLGLAWWINVPYFFSGLMLWVMGLIYNCPAGWHWRAALAQGCTSFRVPLAPPVLFTSQRRADYVCTETRGIEEANLGVCDCPALAKPVAHNPASQDRRGSAGWHCRPTSFLACTLFRVPLALPVLRALLPVLRSQSLQSR